LGGSYPAQAAEIVANELTPVISTTSMAAAIHEAARSRGRQIGIHVKVETGLGRMGILREQVLPFFETLKQMPAPKDEAKTPRTERDLEANPLTKLPGNVSILNELTKRLNNKSLFAVCYIDLDKFKAYNDKYGFEDAKSQILYFFI
jgi:GGDEF domain-containing protein